MYELTLEGQSYNRLNFVFESETEMTTFLVDAVKHSIDEISVTIKRKENSNGTEN